MSAAHDRICAEQIAKSETAKDALLAGGAQAGSPVIYHDPVCNKWFKSTIRTMPWQTRANGPWVVSLEDTLGGILCHRVRLPNVVG